MTKRAKENDARDPWMKFYTRDWQSDHSLRLCSAAARGLWIEMLCIMQRAEPYGHLVLNDGSVPTHAQLAVLTAIPCEQLPPLLIELEQGCVFSRNSRQVIYSRRMVRDEKKARNARENGKKGGNPNIGSKREISAPVNPKNTEDGKPHIPDTRSQKPEKVDPSYWFKGKVIRLNRADYDEFCRISGLDVTAFDKILDERDDWLAEQDDRIKKNWFHSTKKHLAKMAPSTSNPAEA